MSGQRDRERWRRVEELFARALELPPDAREAFLAEACGADVELRRRVARLLEAHDAGSRSGFLATLDPVRASAILDGVDAADPPEAQGDPLPASVGRYEVVRLLGRGGMGVVYLAHDPLLDRPVALKLLAGAGEADGGGDGDADRRLLDEARAASALDHPNIGTVYEVGRADGGRYIAMPCYRGETLRQRIARGPADPAEGARLAAQVADGLAAAHAAGIIHRDIKPENLILTEQGLVKIVDFGIARAAAAEVTTRGRDTPGTPAYMSPEQVGGRAVDARTDLWALGVVLHELLTGRRPAAAGGLHTDARIPPALAEVVGRCLERDPDRRFASAAELARALRAAAARDPRRRRLKAAVGALAVLGVVGIAAAVAGVGPADRDGAATGTPVPWDEREPLVLADFGSSAADPGLGRVITEAVRIDLLQSPVLRLAEPHEAGEAVRRSGADPAAGLTEGVARDVALREGYKAVVAGDVAVLGGAYVLTARLVDAASGNTLAAVRETAADSTTLVEAVGRLSRRVREAAGESLPSLRAARPLPQVATASLPALRRYAEGVALGWMGGDQTRAAELFRQAVSLDTTFAAGYRALSLAYWNARADRDLTVAATRRAYELRDRLAPRERYFVEAVHHWVVRGDPRRTADAYRRALAIDPGHAPARSNLALALLFAGEPVEAERVLRERPPGDRPPDALQLNLARALYFQGRSQAAHAVLDSLLGTPPGSPAAEVLRARILGAAGRWEQADSVARGTVERHRDSPRVRAEALRLRWHLALVRGQLLRADSLAAELFPALRRLGALDELARAMVQEAEARRTLRGDLEGAGVRLDRLLDDPDIDVLRTGATLAPRVAAALAATGDTAGATRLLEQWEATPEETRSDPDSFSPELARARIALRAGRPAEAVSRLRKVADGIQAIHYLPDLAAAHHAAGRGDSAAAVLERYRAFRHTRRIHRIPGEMGPALIRLAELHEAAGDTARALAAHAALAELWAGAHPELRPAVEHARRRIASLSESGL